MSQRVFERHNVNISGRGVRTILFSQGFGCDQRMWRYVVPAFEDDYRVVLFDHVGAGYSDLAAYDPARYSCLDPYADDVIELCGALGATGVTFVGHSVSAIIGVLAANKAPRLFETLIMVGPSPRYTNDGDYEGGFTHEEIEGMLETLDRNYLGWSSAFAPVIMGNADRPHLSQELENSFCQTNPEIARQFARVTFLSDNRSDLARLTVPSLIIQCARDVIAAPPVGEYVHRHTPGSTLTVLDVGGHCPHLSAPDQTIAAIQAYLAAPRR